MLNMNDDIDKMMNYHRTRDMINLLLYFPQISPIEDIIVIESTQDYLDNCKYCGGKSGHRIDSLITKPVINSIETGSDKQDFLKLIKKIKSIDSEGVLVLFKLKNNFSERYERYAGISIGISIRNGIYIDAVGQGFDGREVSKGIVTHESYFIPWNQIKNCYIENFKNFQVYRISEEGYQKSRDERIKFLLSVGYEKRVIEDRVPKIHKEIPTFIWKDIIKNIIRKLPKMEDELWSVGFKEFAISGHTEGKRFMPWQMFDSGRYVLKK
jgi:hypothetical protein